MKNKNKNGKRTKRTKKRRRIVTLAIVGCLLISLSTFLFGALSLVTPSGYEGGNSAKIPSSVIRKDMVNGHSGYIASILLDDDGALNNPLVFLLGYENEGGNGTHSEIYYKLFAEYQGVDIIVFEYLDPSMEIQLNSENVIDFLGELDGLIVGNYNLTVGGKSMGGIIARYVLATTNNSVGIDKMFAIDSPNQGLIFSKWVYSADSAISIGKERYQLIRNFLYGDAAYQLLLDPREGGNPLYDEFIAELHGLESANSYDVIPKIALTHTDNSDNSWTNNWAWLHGEEHGVSSYTEAVLIKNIRLGAKIDFITYASAVDLTDPTIESSFLSNKYNYASTTSSYYSNIIHPLDDGIYDHESTTFPQSEWDHFFASIVEI